MGKLGFAFLLFIITGMNNAAVGIYTIPLISLLYTDYLGPYPISTPPPIPYIKI